MAERSRRITQGLCRLYPTQFPSKPSSILSSNKNLYASSFESYVPSHSAAIFPSRFSNSRNLVSETNSKLYFHGCSSKPTSSSGLFSDIISSKTHYHSPSFGYPLRFYSSGVSKIGFSNSRQLNSQINLKLQVFSSKSLGFNMLNGNSLGSRYISSKTSDFSKLNGNFMKMLFNNPLSAISSAITRYREVVSLQTEAFWKRNFMFLAGAGGLMLCVLLWRIMFGIATTFVGLSEGMAKYGFLALSTAIVAFAGLYVRSRFSINPDKIYRIAMRKLNTSAGILEVMGAPLTGTDLRAYVMSGGGLSLKNFKPRLRNKRCFLLFPIRGSERKGLVSIEVKKKNGQYDMKLLAVDIPMATGPDQRLFLIGDEEEYKIGGGLIAELRDPIVKAMAAEKEFEAIDQKEEEEDAERELQEAERKNQEENEKLERAFISCAIELKEIETCLLDIDGIDIKGILHLQHFAILNLTGLHHL
ncbi:hypothetical protein NE237_010671 [Protea cynaroides]|uniref:Import inner membrane translocase subunit n=1 Tax=Protea cynaroides TaxID=273540 RepID=A0A9Q0L0P4_9MAGN|nr:hypothetical protein NE237_010671 [Protea cynaroides]